jgi:hypothetical protein
VLNTSAVAQVWNLEHVDLPVFSVKAHHGLINCIDGCGGLGIGQRRAPGGSPRRALQGSRTSVPPPAAGLRDSARGFCEGLRRGAAGRFRCARDRYGWAGRCG